jgi:hypothetical protein
MLNFGIKVKESKENLVIKWNCNQCLAAFTMKIKTLMDI